MYKQMISMQYMHHNCLSCTIIMPASTDSTCTTTVYRTCTFITIVDATVSQVAIAWLLHRPSVASVVIGARTLEQLEENLQSVNLHFSKEEVNAGRGCMLIRGVIQPHMGSQLCMLKGPPAISNWKYHISYIHCMLSVLVCCNVFSHVRCSKGFVHVLHLMPV